MKTRNQIKLAVLRAFLIASILLTGECAVAQRFRNSAQQYQLGLDVTFGMKSYTMTSDIDALQNLFVISEGGTIGVSAGSDKMKIKVRQGYYYSATNIGKTIDQLRSAVVSNLYPIQFFSTKETALRPFITAGIERNTLKMYGFYGPDKATMNYSVAEAPYIGKIVTLQANLGAGLEYRIKSQASYVSIFAEAKYSQPMARLFASDFFSNTTSGNQLSMNIGIAFGYHK